MKKDQVQIGGTYVAKVSGLLTAVRIDAAAPTGGWFGTNVETGRKVRIKSAQRLRREARTGPTTFPSAAVQEASAPPSAEAAVAEGEDTGPRCDTSRCATEGCKGEPALTYRGKPLCQRCWERACEQDETAPADGAVTEDHADAATASANHEENQMATKKTTKSKKSAKGTAKADAKPKTTAKPKAPAEKKPKRLSAIDAAAQVLAKAGKPMRSQELIEAMCETGLWKSPAGKTPHATLYAAMLREIAAKGKEARFTKVDRGQFAFNGKAA